MRDPDDDRDPARHLLSRVRYRRLPDGTQQRVPITLDQAAAEFGELIDAGRPAEVRLDPDEGRDEVAAFSRQRAKVIASLLDELSRRVRPGLAVGPIQSDGKLADLAAESAAHLRSGTGY
ncbi:hypothetical protein ACWT_1469 [Actinoplanes sp. SE50]|uniref:hypothetical protein n=1 Tax=unclassified Actinoplanes TaxID=2626549 RepID=UPI00023EC3FE|nr:MULTISPECIES: hypothetical protein [unclassified Actinoplanes]AEV82487.1 hypothetical protein ACPL_1590 [Actinoplanes sp. SE50/110]ATO80884.1 hypothetical protein ACWT_1469 [Actinoplanes sp. SE50]SLL98291.1 hypothetical protein ACSP50_1517 [Actinoplanes sp. SE50/110]